MLAVSKRLEMHSTPMKLAMQSTRARQEITTDKQNLKLESEPSQFTINRMKSELRIDQSACFAEMGSKSPEQFSADNASYGYSMVLQGIERVVDQGNQLAAIENKSDPIPDQANYNAFGQFEKSFNMQKPTGAKPNINFTPAKLDIQYKPAKVHNQSTYQKPQIEYIAGKLDISVAQYNSLEISVVDLKG